MNEDLSISGFHVERVDAVDGDVVGTNTGGELSAGQDGSGAGGEAVDAYPGDIEADVEMSPRSE